MEQKQIAEIVREKNERLERDAVRTAEQIIENIIAEQGKITAAQKVLVQLRAELAALDVRKVEVADILGPSV